MFNNPVLDIVIGLVFIYLLYSLLATTFQELIATKLAFRSKMLEKGIIRMLEDGNSATNSGFFGFIKLFFKPNQLIGRPIATWFYAHPLIKYLGENNRYSKPAYLSAQNFSKVIIDLLRGFDNTVGNDLQKINDSIQKGQIFHIPININNDRKNPAIVALRQQLKDPETKSQSTNLTITPSNVTKVNEDTSLFFQSLWKESGADLDKFKQKLEQWFDDTMQRTSGWFKRYTQTILFFIGLLVAIGFNVDTIAIVQKLSHDPKLREQLVASAKAYTDKKNESDKTTSKSKTDSLTFRSDSLMSAANNLLNGDIKNVNELMGLGWNEKVLEIKGRNYPWFATFCKVYFNKKNDKIECSWSTPFYDVGIDHVSYLSRIVGWLLTALAISLGAPFWFDLLNKLMKLRGAGNKIDSNDSNAEASLSPSTSTSPSVVNVNTQNSEEAVG